MKQEEECKRQKDTGIRFSVEFIEYRRLSQQELHFSFDIQMLPQNFSAPPQAQGEDSLIVRGQFETTSPNNENMLPKIEERSAVEAHGEKILKDHDHSIRRSIPIRSHRRVEVKRRHEHIRGMHLPLCMQTPETCEILSSASKLPPVTTATLNELNLQWIQQNINLRIDINYDHDLHFMPISGARGVEKRNEAHKYWLSLTTEFQIYQHNSIGSCQVCQSQRPQQSYIFTDRLPEMFSQLRSLLITLVPEDDRNQIENNLDVEFVMQQVRHGVLDVVALSKWLAKLLTSHCAPVRDVLAEDMAQKITEGASQGDMGSLVFGLEKLFSFLEAMKLDVANHQIRTFRQPLIEDGVTFQQEFFMLRLQSGELDLKESRQWYQSIDPNKPKMLDINTVVHGLVGLCIDSALQIPCTFKYDIGRIRQIQEQLQDVLHLEICLEVFDRLLYRLLGHEISPAAMHDTLKSRMLKMRIMALADTANNSEATICDMWIDHVDSIAMEITRAAYTVCHKAGYHIPDDVFLDTQWQLRQRFDYEQHKHRDTEQLLEKRIIKETLEHISVFRLMSPSSISEVQRRYQQIRQAANMTKKVPDVEDISRRLAHIATIHWRVWGNLAYCEV